MNYVTFLLRAHTDFNLHSPFLYRLYREVLFAPLPRRRRKELGLRSRQEELRYKLDDALGPDAYLLMPHPHRDEARWKALCAHPKATATLDLYHSGIVLFNPHLSKQHILLR